MTARRTARGFTLIEAMIVVAVVGILAVIGGVAYQKWIRTSYMAEAQDMLAQIRTAEETFRAENGAYLQISPALDPPNMYPAPTPGAFKTAWGLACATCVRPWSALNIEPKGALSFGYAVITDTPTNAAPPAIVVNGAAVDLSAITAPWYIAEAVADVNGDGVFTKVYGFSNGGGHLLVDHEGE